MAVFVVVYGDLVLDFGNKGYVFIMLASVLF